MAAIKAEYHQERERLHVRYRRDSAERELAYLGLLRERRGWLHQNEETRFRALKEEVTLLPSLGSHSPPNPRQVTALADGF